VALHSTCGAPLVGHCLAGNTPGWCWLSASVALPLVAAPYPCYVPTATFKQASRRQKGADLQQALLCVPGDGYPTAECRAAPGTRGSRYAARCRRHPPVASRPARRVCYWSSSPWQGGMHSHILTGEREESPPTQRSSFCFREERALSPPPT